jgi:cation diffusion facilitator family transporter
VAKIRADLGVAIAKVVAGVVTGSSAVAASASESLADTFNDLFLLLAQRRSSRRADDQHALGYGREAYFWALLAGLGVFLGGAVFSLREGIDQLAHPSGTSHFVVAYVVLAISAGLDLTSFRQSTGQLTRRARRFHRDLHAEAQATSDPTLRTVFLSDALSMAADVITLGALAITQVTGSSIAEGVAAILIGLALIAIGLRLIRRSHDFLVGAWVSAGGEAQNSDIAGFTQPLLPAWEERARAFLLAYPGVSGIREVLTTFVGPGQVWIVARLDINDDLRGDQIEALVRGVESGMKEESEHIYRVDVVPIGAGQVQDDP